MRGREGKRGKGMKECGRWVYIIIHFDLTSHGAEYSKSLFRMFFLPFPSERLHHFVVETVSDDVLIKVT